MLQRLSAQTPLSTAVDEHPCKFGTVVHALAGRHKPAAWLAEKLGCTERGARYLIDGQRSVTAHALKAIIDEILG